MITDNGNSCHAGCRNGWFVVARIANPVCLEKGCLLGVILNVSDRFTNRADFFSLIIGNGNV